MTEEPVSRPGVLDRKTTLAFLVLVLLLGCIGLFTFFQFGRIGKAGTFQVWCEAPSEQAPGIVVLRSGASPHQIRHLLSLGARRYLTRPIQVAQFLQVLDDLLPQRPGP